MKLQTQWFGSKGLLFSMNNPRANTWQLIKQYAFEDSPETVGISTGDSLRSILREHVNQRPIILTLKRPDNGFIQLGIGGTLAGILIDPNTTNKPPRYAKPRRTYSDKVLVFAFEGNEIGFPANCLMPAEQAINIICDIYATTRLPDSVEWIKGWEEEIAAMERAKECRKSELGECQKSELGDIPF